MAIFSWKSKSKKEEEKKKEEAAAAAESKPAKEPYKHIPKHAAVDSLGQGGRSESAHDLQRIASASRMRRQNSMFDSTLANASYAQDIAHNMAHGMSTPSSFNRRTNSNDAFTTHANDYFSPTAMRKLQANDPSLGYHKVAIARQDLHYASDSGYESAGPSRAPSEQNLDEMPRQTLTRPNGGLLPELKLGDDSRSVRSSRSTTKKTRFQVDTEPVVLIEQPASRAVNLASLEGYKVNKKGKVLDEEGDVIGELVDGDLLDCVRQKVNAKGEVVDDVGRVVGTVRPAAASLPSLTVISPASAQTEGDVSPTIAPRSPAVDPTHSPQETPRRPVRSASERSLSELSKPYARPPMSSVPENNVPGEDGVVAAPELFAYRGEVPEGPHQHIRRRSSSPPPVLGAPMNARKLPSRRVSTSGLSSRSMGKQPMGYAPRRPMSSYDYSPNGSDDGTDTSNSDDGRFPHMSYKRPMSVRSVSTYQARPRTYFTHSGRITVDPNAPALARTQSFNTKATTAPTSPNATPAPVAAKEEKKKSRLSIFGKK